MRSLLFTFFVYASLANAASLGIRSAQEDSVGVDKTVDRIQDQTTFSRLLSAVSPRALQQLMHEYISNPFKNDVLGSDHDAVDVVYVRSPILATSIVHLAVRQASSGNDTTTSDTPTSSDEPPTTSTSDTPSTTPTEEPTTSSTEVPPTETTETPPDTQPTSSSTPSSTPTPTPTPAPTTEPSSTPETPTETPEPTSSTPAPTSESSIDGDSSSTPSTFSTSTTPVPTSTTSTFTSTLPGGVVTTVTEVAVITPGVPQGDNSAPTDGMGNLQTGDSAAPSLRGPGFGIIAGFLLGGAMFV
ncbi:hypothetical protein F4803DRAFT_548183 [Xylaria telfairii]|nr:hypothetical protein F4803DRAFT_548183 [Xylaria telfairii]